MGLKYCGVAGEIISIAAQEYAGKKARIEVYYVVELAFVMISNTCKSV